MKLKQSKSATNLVLTALFTGLLVATPNAALATGPTPNFVLDPALSTTYAATGTTVTQLKGGATTGNTATGVTSSSATGITLGTDGTTSNVPYFNFSGTSYANFPTYDFGTQFTMTVWVKPRAKTSINTIVANATAYPGYANNGFKFSWNNWQANDHAIVIEAGNASRVGGKPHTLANQVTEGDWQQIAYTMNTQTNTVTLYRNGSQQCITGSLPAGVGTNQAWIIGAMLGNSYSMNAMVGKMKIYPSVLSQTDIISDYDASKSAYNVTAPAILAGDPPANFVAPAFKVGTTVVTSARVGNVLVADSGSWYNSCGISYTYQWSSSDSQNGTFTNISGASTATYTAAAGDSGKWLRIGVTGTSGGQSATAYRTIQVAAVVGTTAQASLTLPSASAPKGTQITLAATGGSGTGALTYTFTGTGCSIVLGKLSSTSTGSCVVTATKAGDATYLAASVTTTFTFTEPAPNIFLTSSQLLGDSGTAIISYDILNRGGALATSNPYSISTSPNVLPSWAIFDSTTGKISGTPTETMTAKTFTITATGINGDTSTALLTLTVTDVATGPDIRIGNSVTFESSTVYTIQGQESVPLAEMYIVNFGDPANHFSISPDLSTITSLADPGVYVDGLTFDSTTGIVSGTPGDAFAAITFTITAYAGTNELTSDSSTATLTLSATPVAPIISLDSADLVGTAGMALTPWQITNDGGNPWNYYLDPVGGTVGDQSALTNIGLTFDPNSGLITGTPTGALAITRYILTAETGLHNSSPLIDTVAVSVLINPAPVAPQAPAAPQVQSYPTPIWQVTSVGAMKIGQAISTRLFATYATSYVLSAGSIPAGLAFNTATGVISGLPTTAGTYTFTLTAICGNQSVTQTFTGEVAGLPTPPPAPKVDTPTVTPKVDTSTPTRVVKPTPTVTLGQLVSPSSPVAQNANILPPVIQPAAVIIGHPQVFEVKQRVPATVLPNNTNDGLVVNASGWKITIAANPASGIPLQLDQHNNIVVNPGIDVAVTGLGFKPFSYAKVYIFSTPTLLGVVKTDASGRFIGTLPLPDGLNLGEHVIQVSGFSNDNKERDALLGVVAIGENANVANPAPTPLTPHPVSNGVIPFDDAKYALGAKQIQIVKSYTAKPTSRISVVGYASKTAGEDDIRISLDRALEVKSMLAKRFPGAIITALGSGTTRNPLCDQYANRCVVVKVKP